MTWARRRIDQACAVVREVVTVEQLAELPEVVHYSVDGVAATGGPIRQSGQEIASSKLKVDGGEILVSRLNPRRGHVTLTQAHDAPAVCSGEYAVLRPRDGDARFFAYFFQAAHVRDELEAQVRSVTKSHGRVDFAAITKLTAPIPSAGEQKRIANYLDLLIHQIDRTRNLNSQMSSLLRERLAALVSREATLTGESVALGRFVRGVEQGTSPVCDLTARPSEDEWGVLKLSAVTGGTFRPSEHKHLLVSPGPTDLRYEVQVGDVLMTRANTPELVGDACFVAETPPRLLLPDLVYRLAYDPNRIHGPWLARVLRSHQLRSQITGVARGSSQSMVKLRGEDIRGLRLDVPPIAEQRRQEQLTAAHAALTESLIGDLARQNELLTERRQALITAAVTGQLEIGEAA